MSPISALVSLPCHPVFAGRMPTRAGGTTTTSTTTITTGTGTTGYGRAFVCK